MNIVHTNIMKHDVKYVAFYPCNKLKLIKYATEMNVRIKKQVYRFLSIKIIIILWKPSIVQIFGYHDYS